MTERDPAADATHWRAGLLVALGILMVGGAALAPPVAQDPAYHNFADQRMLLRVPNFLNVASNLPFLLIGALGLAFLLRDRRAGGPSAFAVPGDRRPYWPFFTGVALTDEEPAPAFEPEEGPFEPRFSPSDPPAELFRPSPRPYPRRLIQAAYPDEWRSRAVRGSGQIKWGGRDVRITGALSGERIGLEPVGDGVWRIHFLHQPLGYFSERDLTVRSLTRPPKTTLQ